MDHSINDLAWLDELDLDPTSTPLKMGTRALGGRPWLVPDSNRSSELLLRRQLLSERRDEVFRCADGARAAAGVVEHLVGTEVASWGEPVVEAGERHPLENAGQMVQEDLVLLRWYDDAWRIDAACLCFPSRWRLAEKFGRPLIDVHRPVEDYDPVLAARVSSLLHNLGDRPVWRRNWFLHANGDLFQPWPPTKEPVISADRCGDELFVRSERQTLRAIDDGSSDQAWILFTIRIQQCPLRSLMERRGPDVARLLAGAKPEMLRRHGVVSQQITPLKDALRLMK